MDPYEALANAIILQAVTDYRKALKQLARTPDYKPALKDKRECEAFFQSQWFKVLTTVDGTRLMNQLQKEVV